MGKKLINICGTARSGSTMVDLMVGNDNRAFSLGEVSAWFRPYRTHHFKINCTCGHQNCPWNQLKTVKERDFHKRCFEILDVDVLVDSSKSIPWVIDNNLKAMEDHIPVYNVLLYKDPISFFYSFWKRGLSIDRARRREFIGYYNRFFESNLPFISLNYNELVNDPPKTLNNLCQLLEIPYFEGKERFWEKEHHHLFGSRGTRNQIGNPNAKIKKSERYPVEFETIIPKIDSDNFKNETFQTILLKLKSNEMKKMNCNLTEGAICKPYWYYLSKLKQGYRRRFPQKWKHDL